jgi:hypothetical protein
MVFNASQQSDFTFQKNSGSDLSWVLVEQIFMSARNTIGTKGTRE